MAIALGVHLSWLNSFDTSIIYYAYSANLILAISIYSLITNISKKHLHLSGFLFMGGSFIKFAVFYIFFYPAFMKDGQIDKTEASYFLIPYFLGLIWETYYLSRKLNSSG
jgi:hypothetical protein